MKNQFRAATTIIWQVLFCVFLATPRDQIIARKHASHKKFSSLAERSNFNHSFFESSCTGQDGRGFFNLYF